MRTGTEGEALKDGISKKEIRLYYLTVALSAVGFLLLFCAVPFTMDDWAWGSETGLARLQNGFAGYNGRYLGNLLVIALTRCAALRIPFMAGVSVLLARAVAGFLTKRQSAAGYLSALCIILSCALFGLAGGRLNIFAQTVGWISGFCNYVVPTVFVLFYLRSVLAAFENEDKKQNEVLYAVSGFASALFAEHITLSLIVISALVNVFYYRKFRKVNAAFALHFASVSAGASLMFSNSSYLLLLRGNAVSGGMRGLGFLGKTALDVLAGRLGISPKTAIIILGVTVLLYILALVFTKDKGLRFLLVCAGIITLPLLFTNGGSKAYLFTARLYFTQYLLVMIWLAGLAKSAVKNKKARTAAKALIIASACALTVFTAVIYVRVYQVNASLVERIERTKNESAVEVIDYPDSLKRFVYMPDAYRDEAWAKHFKNYYKIPEDRKLEIIESE